VALVDLHRLPGDRPDIESLLESGELITAVELAALPVAMTSTYRRVCDRASYVSPWSRWPLPRKWTPGR
jgi:xanthine dehydrogenase YagS FAD-binding subunit